MQQVLNISKALSDESRLRVLFALLGGELCVCQIIDLLSLAPSTVSKHMTILVQAGLAVCRKDGRWHYYRLPTTQEASPAVQATLDWLESVVGCCSMAQEDSRRLKEICRRQKEEVSACCYRN